MMGILQVLVMVLALVVAALLVWQHSHPGQLIVAIRHPRSTPIERVVAATMLLVLGLAAFVALSWVGGFVGGAIGFGTPAATLTPTPWPTKTPRPTYTVTPLRSPTAIPPTSTPVPPTQTRVPTQTPAPTHTVPAGKPTSTPAPTNTPAPTETPTPAPTFTIMPLPGIPPAGTDPLGLGAVPAVAAPIELPKPPRPWYEEVAVWIWDSKVWLIGLLILILTARTVRGAIRGVGRVAGGAAGGAAAAAGGGLLTTLLRRLLGGGGAPPTIPPP